MKLFPNFLIFSNVAFTEGIVNNVGVAQCGENCKISGFQDLMKWQVAEINENIEVRKGKYGTGIFAKSEIKENENIHWFGLESRG